MSMCLLNLEDVVIIEVGQLKGLKFSNLNRSQFTDRYYPSCDPKNPSL